MFLKFLFKLIVTHGAAFLATVGVILLIVPLITPLVDLPLWLWTMIGGMIGLLFLIPAQHALHSWLD
jgi:hypothetical protein